MKHPPLGKQISLQDKVIIPHEVGKYKFQNTLFAPPLLEIMCRLATWVTPVRRHR